MSLRDDARRPDEAHFTRLLLNVMQENMKHILFILFLAAFLALCFVVYANIVGPHPSAGAYIAYRDVSEAQSGIELDNESRVNLVHYIHLLHTCRKDALITLLISMAFSLATMVYILSLKIKLRHNHRIHSIAGSARSE